jgi:hypothetical protein
MKTSAGSCAPPQTRRYAGQHGVARLAQSAPNLNVDPLPCLGLLLLLLLLLVVGLLLLLLASTLDCRHCRRLPPVCRHGGFHQGKCCRACRELALPLPRHTRTCILRFGVSL